MMPRALSIGFANDLAVAGGNPGETNGCKKRPDDSGLFVCLLQRLFVVFAQLELSGHLLLHVGRNGRIAGELDGVAALPAG